MAFVQRLGTASGTGSSLSLSITANGTDGNTAVLAVSNRSGFTVTSVTDSRGNTWTIANATAAGAPGLTLARSTMAAHLRSGDTVTINLSGSLPLAGAAVVYEYAGLIEFESSATAAATSSVSSLASGSTAAVNSSDLLFAVAGYGANQGTITQPSGYTVRSSNSGLVSLADEAPGSAGSYSATWAWTTASTAVVGLWVMTAVRFGAAAGGFALAGSASGHAPPIVRIAGVTGSSVKSINEGHLSGAVAFAGAAVGSATHSGAGAGTFRFTGAAAGHSPNGGTAAGTITLAGASAGTQLPLGTSGGTLTYTGSAAGSTPGTGTASGAFTWTGHAAGNDGVPLATPPGRVAAVPGIDRSSTIPARARSSPVPTRSRTVTV